MTSRRLIAIQTALALSLCAFAGRAAGAPIKLHVDASQVQLKIIRVRMEVTAKPGPLTLCYPKWIPGEHGPDGPIGNLHRTRDESRRAGAALAPRPS